jgi:hypothetical protein
VSAPAPGDRVLVLATDGNGELVEAVAVVCSVYANGSLDAWVFAPTGPMVRLGGLVQATASDESTVMDSLLSAPNPFFPKQYLTLEDAVYRLPDAPAPAPAPAPAAADPGAGGPGPAADAGTGTGAGTP